MTIEDATKNGICRLRDPRWVNPEAYIRIAIFEVDGGKLIGPWVKLYDRRTQEIIGEPTPQTFSVIMLVFGDNTGVEYTGLLDKDDVQ